jgi:hypothetical protein
MNTNILDRNISKEEKEQMQDLGVDETHTLKWILEKKGN